MGQFLVSFSRGICQADELEPLLGCPVIGPALPFFSTISRGSSCKHSSADAILGWGKKANTQKARLYAGRKNIPFWHLEDGYISYLGHPALGDTRFSLIVDKTSIYYDATAPSDLENLLNNPEWAIPEYIDPSQSLLHIICQQSISKYNHEPVTTFELNTQSRNNVLVIDQTYGDCSVLYGMADENSFQQMLKAALTENPESDVWVKVHPDVVLGTKKGYLGNNLPEHPRLHVLSEKVNAQSLFPYFEKVYVVTSQLGFEALWHKKEVVCFGVPFYSGWGLTDDRIPCPRRTQKHTIESLFAAACLKYTRYINPETHERCELEDVLDLIILQRQYQKQQVKTLYAIGFSLWKRAFINRFTQGLAERVIFLRNHKALNKRLTSEDGVLVWGMAEIKTSLDVPIWRMEDGFIRSCGLGAELRRPGSLVLDKRGIYYNAQQTSDLESALNTLNLSETELRRGQNLISLYLSNRVSKYNLSASSSADAFQGAAPGQRKILITGQVDSDASLQYGSPNVSSNKALLKHVNMALKDQNTYVVYKPHPDVIQAGRSGHIPEQEVLQWADAIVTDIDIFDCIEQCDEVHVMSSLSGFEALLQGKEVHCWGLPFYAGWGLTADHIQCTRRMAQRSLPELVFIALAHYPRYINWRTGRFTTPESMIRSLSNERNSLDQHTTALGKWFSRKKRKLKFLLETIF